MLQLADLGGKTKQSHKNLLDKPVNDLGSLHFCKFLKLQARLSEKGYCQVKIAVPELGIKEVIVNYLCTT